MGDVRDSADAEHTVELGEFCTSAGSATDSDSKLDVEDSSNTLLNVGSGVDRLELFILYPLAIAGAER